MELKNLMDKLHHDTSAAAEPQQQAAAYRPPVPQVPRPPAAQPNFQEQISSRQAYDRGANMADDDGGIVLDLGDGISLNIPVKKRMSLTEFLRLAEKVKALEILGEEAQHIS